MIFVTAGTQLPFDRLIEVIDEIAGRHPEIEFVVQALKSDYKAKHIKILDFISPADFNNYVDNSELIIAHAGMGTIISALVKQKPIIVFPRLTKYKEHRNEHQLATCRQMDHLNYVYVAYDEKELVAMFKWMWPDNLKPRNSIKEVASDHIISSIDDFIRY